MEKEKITDDHLTPLSPNTQEYVDMLKEQIKVHEGSKKQAFDGTSRCYNAGCCKKALM